MPLVKSVRYIKEHIQEIRIEYNANINKKRTKAPYLLNKKDFAKLKHLLTWYSLGKL